MDDSGASSTRRRDPGCGRAACPHGAGWHSGAGERPGPGRPDRTPDPLVRHRRPSRSSAEPPGPGRAVRAAAPAPARGGQAPSGRRAVTRRDSGRTGGCDRRGAGQDRRNPGHHAQAGSPCLDRLCRVGSCPAWAGWPGPVLGQAIAAAQSATARHLSPGGAIAGHGTDHRASRGGIAGHGLNRAAGADSCYLRRAHPWCQAGTGCDAVARGRRPRAQPGRTDRNRERLTVAAQGARRPGLAEGSRT
ncbi:MAG: hypothetical protein JWM19_1138 [Actinomycetia bacterium]|nr:hypothetical protein [Actinomycetes bacterium]